MITELKANVNLVVWSYVTANVADPKFVNITTLYDPDIKHGEEVFGVEDVEPNTIVSYNPIRIRFGYPMARSAVFDFPGPITVKDFITKVAETYRTIYNEEEMTSPVRVGRGGQGLLNRNQTEGKYGIWGHDLTDLYLEHAKLGDDGIWELGIGS